MQRLLEQVLASSCFAIFTTAVLSRGLLAERRLVGLASPRGLLLGQGVIWMELAL